MVYTDTAITLLTLKRAISLTSGLNAKIRLVAVHSVPYPRDFDCPSWVHAYLVERLIELSDGCPVPVTPLVVMARSREEGLESVLEPESLIVIGSRRRPWRTPEERLARVLADVGHRVALIHVAAGG